MPIAIYLPRPSPNGREWHVCTVCELQLVHPLDLDETPVALYSGAYRGMRSESNMEEFSDRLQIRRALIEKDPSLWFWTPAFERTFDWLETRVGKGATVFEIGCGLGWVLHVLRNRGFRAVGLDVAKTPVELNRADGFQVWHGSLETLEDGWVHPNAVIAFFMLHHVQHPLAFLRLIRERFPKAPLSIAQYGPSNLDPIASMPPRTLTRWNTTSLHTLLRLAGYEATVVQLAGTGNEASVMRPLRKIMKRTIAFPPVYRFARRIEHRIIGRLLSPVGRHGYVVHALAEPLDIGSYSN